MATKNETLANLLACYDSIETVCAELTDSEWATRSLCPDWTVKDVVTHLAGVESVLIGWMPESVETPVPFEKLGSFMAEAESMSGQELAARQAEVYAARRAELAELTDEQFDAPSMTPVGPQTYGRFMAVRVFDFWIHERDIRIPIGRPGDNGGPVAEMALDETHRSMGYIVGKRIGLPDGMSIRFRLTGPVERHINVVVDGRAALVDELDGPDLEVVTDSLTFNLLACGRIDPQIPIDDGDIKWYGDDEWGEKAARNLRYTM